jgi:Flp pilus assembly protein TadD
MPIRRPAFVLLHASRAAIVFLLLSAALSACGCRVLRRYKASDESISAARQLSLQGLDAQQRGHWDRAEMLFAAAILKCPSDERARCGYAESLWQRGAASEAIDHMEEAARLSGDDPERLVRLGQMYRARGDLARAGRQADLAIAANPQLAKAWALRGSVLQAEGNRSEALANYHRALSYEESLPDVQLAIAEIYAQENRPQRALATLQALAASFAPSQVPPEVLVAEGRALVALGRPQDASRVLAQAARQPNPPIELLVELARTQMLAGEPSAARQTVAATLARDPQHAGCLALEREWGLPQPAVARASAVDSRPR